MAGLSSLSDSLPTQDMSSLNRPQLLTDHSGRAGSHFKQGWKHMRLNGGKEEGGGAWIRTVKMNRREEKSENLLLHKKI